MGKGSWNQLTENHWTKYFLFFSKSSESFFWKPFSILGSLSLHNSIGGTTDWNWFVQFPRKLLLFQYGILSRLLEFLGFPKTLKNLLVHEIFLLRLRGDLWSVRLFLVCLNNSKSFVSISFSYGSTRIVQHNDNPCTHFLKISDLAF